MKKAVFKILKFVLEAIGFTIIWLLLDLIFKQPINILNTFIHVVIIGLGSYWFNDIAKKRKDRKNK